MSIIDKAGTTATPKSIQATLGISFYENWALGMLEFMGIFERRDLYERKYFFRWAGRFYYRK